MVKCPLLFEHEPCDLVQVRNCYTCEHFGFVERFKIDCRQPECIKGEPISDEICTPCDWADNCPDRVV